MRKIKGFNFTGTWVNEGLSYIESAIGHQLTDEQAHEVGKLWDWNYNNDDAIEMLQLGLTADEFEPLLFLSIQ